MELIKRLIIILISIFLVPSVLQVSCDALGLGDCQVEHSVSFEDFSEDAQDSSESRAEESSDLHLSIPAPFDVLFGERPNEIHSQKHLFEDQTFSDSKFARELYKPPCA